MVLKTTQPLLRQIYLPARVAGQLICIRTFTYILEGLVPLKMSDQLRPEDRVMIVCVYVYNTDISILSLSQKKGK